MTNLDWDLLDRYLAGEATAAERERFEQWLAERPQRVAHVEGIRRALETLDTGVPAAEREAMWEAMFGGAIAAGAPRPAARFSLEAARRERPRSRISLAVAAATLIVIGGALAGRAWLGAAHGSAAPERVITVPRGQQARLRLPDETEVILGSGSTLRHPEMFGASSREVTLEGEAYFTVQHDARRPFQVRAGDLVATDLGTEFLVRAYPEDQRARVVVRSGMVAVRASRVADATAGRAVRPGEMGRLDSNGSPLVEPADTAAYFAWTRGTLVFDGTLLRDALPQLSRWYDLDFQLADSSLGSIPLSGTLDRTLTADRLELLAASLGLRQERNGHVVRLRR